MNPILTQLSRPTCRASILVYQWPLDGLMFCRYRVLAAFCQRSSSCWDQYCRASYRWAPLCRSAHARTKIETTTLGPRTATITKTTTTTKQQQLHLHVRQQQQLPTATSAVTTPMRATATTTTTAIPLQLQQQEQQHHQQQQTDS